MPSPTPLVPAPRISAALDIDVHLKLETANPTHSFKDRMAASALAAAQGFGIETIFCASTGNLGAAVAARCAAAGLEGVILSPADTDEPVASVGDLRRERLHGAGNVRGLPSPGAGARAPLPVGLPRGEPASVRGRGRSRRSRTRSRSSSAGRRRTRSSARSRPGRSSRSSPRGSSSSPTSGSSSTGRRGCTARSLAVARRSPPRGPTSVRRRA